MAIWFNIGLHMSVLMENMQLNVAQIMCGEKIQVILKCVMALLCTLH